MVYKCVYLYQYKTVFLRTLPRIGKTESQHFLQLEISIVFFCQRHTIIIAEVEENLSGQVTVQLELYRIFPVHDNLVVSCKVIELARSEEKVKKVFKDNLPTIIYGDIRNKEN